MELFGARHYGNWLKQGITEARLLTSRDGKGSFFGKAVVGPKQSWLWDEEVGLGWEGSRT